MKKTMILCLSVLSIKIGYAQTATFSKDSIKPNSVICKNEFGLNVSSVILVLGEQTLPEIGGFYYKRNIGHNWYLRGLLHYVKNSDASFIKNYKTLAPSQTDTGTYAYSKNESTKKTIVIGIEKRIDKQYYMLFFGAGLEGGLYKEKRNNGQLTSTNKYILNSTASIDKRNYSYDENTFIYGTQFFLGIGKNIGKHFNINTQITFDCTLEQLQKMETIYNNNVISEQTKNSTITQFAFSQNLFSHNIFLTYRF